MASKIRKEMKTIAVIPPINNPEILSQEDLESYQSGRYCFKVIYPNTELKELNTASDVEEVIALVLKKIQEAEQDGASAVIVFAFGDVGIKEGRKLVSIPLMGLGKAAVHMASLFCKHRFTVIPGQLSHNTFIEELVREENLQHKFIAATHAVNLNPSEIRKNHSSTLDALVSAASEEIIKKDIDTFTLGCGSFINFAKPLQQELRKRHNKLITVIDQVSVSFGIAMSLCR